MPKKRIYYSEFRRALDQGPLKPVYFFTGAESFLKDQGLRAVVEKALPPAERSLNLEMLYAGTDVSGREVRERALTLPFLAERRVLVVRQAEKWNATDLAALGDYCDNPSPASVLIILSQEERLKQVHWKNWAAKTYHVECYPLFDNQVPQWLEHRVREHGKQISREAGHMLIERVGQNLADLENEISKLINYIGAQSRIELQDIEAAAGYLRQNTLQELNHALGSANTATAISLVDFVLAEGFRPPQILAALTWHFRGLLTARAQLDAGEDEDKILSAIRHPQARRAMLSQMRTYPREAFDKIFKEFLLLDERMKTGKTHWVLFLQLAILRICGLVGKTARA